MTSQIENYDREIVRLNRMMMELLQDSSLMAVFDDAVSITVDKDLYNEVISMLYQNDYILQEIDALHCNDADEGC